MAEKKEMSLPQHREIILKWVKSCWSSEQLDLLENVIGEFISKRFRGYIEKEVKKEEKPGMVHDLHITEYELGRAIVDQRVIVAGVRKKIKLRSAPSPA